MDLDLALKALIAIAPVIALLLAFDRLDIFDLVSFREIALLLLTGAALAGLALLVNTRGVDGFPIGFSAYTRYVSPVVEETLKAAPLIVLFAINRLGYKLDSAMAGFAIGAGFSVLENAWFLWFLGDANFSAWLVRGFGTAVMHGGATALFAVISHEFSEHQAEARAAHYRFNPLVFLPGLAAAIAVHSGFNHFPDEPIVTMAVTLLLVPMILLVVFAQSDLATHRWLKDDHDAHVAILADIDAGRFPETEAGRAIAAACARFDGVAIADAYAHVALSTRLVLRAEELMLRRDEVAKPGEAERRQFAELDALEKRLGAMVVNAILVHAHLSRNDIWELGRLRALLRRAK